MPGDRLRRNQRPSESADARTNEDLEDREDFGEFDAIDDDEDPMMRAAAILIEEKKRDQRRNPAVCGPLWNLLGWAISRRDVGPMDLVAIGVPRPDP